MAGCIQHNFVPCAIKSATCESCCAREGKCTALYYTPIVGTANNLQVGDQLWSTSSCSGEPGPGGACEQPNGETRIYGCVTVANGLVTAIAACSGEVSCGSGAGETCKTSTSLASTLKNHRWTGRQIVSVAALDTWEIMYQAPSSILANATNDNVCYTQGHSLWGYLKQIYIHNCDNGSTNDKKFSIRIYNGTTGTMAISECTISTQSIPAEVHLANYIKVADGERYSVLGFESPLKLHIGDEIHVQSHTATSGFTISAWIETTVPYNEHFQSDTTLVNEQAGTAGPNHIKTPLANSIINPLKTIDNQVKTGKFGGTSRYDTEYRDRNEE